MDLDAHTNQLGMIPRVEPVPSWIRRMNDVANRGHVLIFIDYGLSIVKNIKYGYGHGNMYLPVQSRASIPTIFT